MSEKIAWLSLVLSLAVEAFATSGKQGRGNPARIPVLPATTVVAAKEALARRFQVQKAADAAVIRREKASEGERRASAELSSLRQRVLMIPGDFLRETEGKHKAASDELEAAKRQDLSARKDLNLAEQALETAREWLAALPFSTRIGKEAGFAQDEWGRVRAASGEAFESELKGVLEGRFPDSLFTWDFERGGQDYAAAQYRMLREAESAEAAEKGFLILKFVRESQIKGSDFAEFLVLRKSAPRAYRAMDAAAKSETIDGYLNYKFTQENRAADQMLREADQALLDGAVDMAEAQLDMRDGELKAAGGVKGYELMVGARTAAKEEFFKSIQAALENARAEVRGAEEDLKAGEENVELLEDPKDLTGRLMKARERLRRLEIKLGAAEEK